MCLCKYSLTALLILAARAQDHSEQECNEHRFACPFTPGDSGEDIYNENEQTHDKPGYYWILGGIRVPSLVYCGMGYTGSSCEDLYVKNIKTHDKSRYYRIIDAWAYYDMTVVSIAFNQDDLMSSCVGVSGIWKRIAGFTITARDDCPSPWVKNLSNGSSFCIQPPNDTGSCSSVNYSTSGMS